MFFYDQMVITLLLLCRVFSR